MACLFGLIGLLLFCIGSTVLSVYIKRHDHAYHAAKEQQATALYLARDPLYQQKVQNDRAHELALMQMQLKSRELAIKETHISVTQYGLVLPHSYAHNMVVIPPIHRPEALPPQVTVTEAPPFPDPYDFLAELHTGWRPSHAGIFLARTASGPILVPSNLLWHVALAGPTGGGKTTILRTIFSQLLYLGATGYLFDRFYAPIKKGIDWRPIANKLAVPPIRDYQEMVEVMDWLVAGELAARIDREYRGEAIGEPMYIALEEMPLVVAEVPQIAEPIGRLLRQGRQYDLCFIGAMQDALAKTLGIPSGLRECFRSAYYCGGDQTTARALLDLSRSQLNEDGLGVDGRVYLKTARTSAQEVRVPWASNESMTLLLGPGNALPAAEAVPGVPEHDTDALKQLNISQEERDRIIQLAKDGTPRRDMCGKLRKGKGYYKTVQQVLDAEGL
jgi:hypothetical protein